MSYREDQREVFDRQMRAWSDKQGLWHQLTGSAGDAITVRVLKFATTCFALCLVAIVLMVIYIFVRVESGGFETQVEKSLAEALYADEIEVNSIDKTSSVASIRKIDFTGSDRSFFNRAEAHNVSFPMKALNGLIGEWKLGVIKLQSLDIDIKSGGGTDDRSRVVYQSLLDGADDLNFNRIDVADASFSWGYSELDRGEVSGSKLMATKVGDTWELKFEGGYFSFHWLNNVPIESMLVTCNEMGVVIKDARLYSGEGKLDFNAKIAVGSKPKVTGSLKMSSMPVELMLPVAYQKLISGSVSAEGALSGALNSEHSVLTDLNVTLQEQDSLTFLETVPLLEALSIIDSEEGYRKLAFDTGGFRLRSSGERAVYSDVKLDSASECSVTGDFEIRPPSNGEIAQRLDIEVEDVKNAFYGRVEFSTELGALEIGKVIDDGIINSYDTMQKTIITKERANKSYSGSLRLALHPKAFDKTASLRESYPVDATEGKAVINVALEGPFSSLTKELSEKLYRLGLDKTEN